MLPKLVGGRCSVQPLLHSFRTTSLLPRLYSLFYNCVQCRHSTFFSSLPATEWTQHNCTSNKFLPHISRRYSSLHLLKSLANDIQQESLALPDFPERLEGLVDGVYLDFSNTPWIHHHNQPIAFMQLLINEKVNDFMQPILDEPDFKSLLDFLSGNLALFSDELIPRFLYSIIFLGVDITDPIVHKMLYRIYYTPVTMDMKNIATITECLRVFPRGDFKISEQLSKWIQVNIENKEYQTSMDIHDLSRTIINMRQFSSSQRLSSALRLSMDLIEREQGSLTMLQLGSALRLFRHLTFHVPSDHRPEIQRSVQRIMELVVDKIDDFECHNFADICHMLKVMNFYPQKLMQKFQARAMDIFESRPVKISELINLCYVFNKHIPLVTRHKIESALYQNMHEADILLLSNIADILSDIDCSNSDLIHLYQELVLENLVGIQKFITRFYKVFRFLNRSRITNLSMESAYYTKVLKLLDSQQGISVWTICTLSSFLLPISKPVIPEILMKKLLLIIPQCDVNNLAMILYGLNRMKKPWVRQMHNQVLHLQTALHQNMNDQLHKVTSIDPLIQMAQVLYIKSDRRELVLLDNIISTMSMLTHTLTMRHFRNIISLFSQLRYHAPRIMNDLVEFAIANHEDMNFHDFSSLVRIVSFIGIQPDRFDDFQEVCIKMLDEHIKENNLLKQLNFTLDLCQMQIFPDNWLSSIFTLKYIESIDQYMEKNKEKKNPVQRILMMLNRTVVLDCPHLDIPWFHEDFCQKNMATGYSTWMHEEIQSALQEIVGGEKFLQTFVHTPYYYLIDYEIILDQNQNVVKHSIANILKPQNLNYQRIALIVLMEKSFPINRRNLLGSWQMFIRHLEMLGYKTVLIPYFDWNSMALTEWSEKLDYLRKKIYS